jgi:NAD(P)-dependent dehydrogenase (short-subunit alcohol dehydrogenase family)
VCLRPDGIPEPATIGEVYGLHAEGAGMACQEFGALMVAQTHLRRLPTPAEMADVAAFIASDCASAMTGAVANISCGTVAE